jgi:hypothetical protein
MIVSRFIHSLGAKGDDPGKPVFPQQKLMKPAVGNVVKSTCQTCPQYSAVTTRCLPVPGAFFSAEVGRGFGNLETRLTSGILGKARLELQAPSEDNLSLG